MSESYDKMILSACKSLAERECANYFKGMCLETDTPCFARLINTAYGSVRDGAINCDWFYEGVLPLDRKLIEIVHKELFTERSLYDDEDDALEEEHTLMKQCSDCGSLFVPNSNRQQYCLNCAYRRKLESNASAHRKRYWYRI